MHFDKSFPEDLKTILELCGYRSEKTISRCASEEKFVSSLENYIKDTLAKMCKKWEREKTEAIFGIYVDSPDDFEFNPGQKNDLGTLFENCRAINLVVSDSTEPPTKKTKATPTAKESNTISSVRETNVDDDSSQSELLKTITKYVMSIPKLSDILDVDKMKLTSRFLIYFVEKARQTLDNI